jgi:regulator of protease activity HflC (stomatin/prohibitin superfamily)
MKQIPYRDCRGISTIGFIAIAAIIALLIGSVLIVKVRSVESNEVGIVQTWGGIEPETKGTGTYFLFPGYSKQLFAYDTGIQTYVMNDKDDKQEVAEGRKTDAYVVQSKDQQDMRISLRIQWRRLPDKIIALHKYAPNNVEERILRPVLQSVVKNHATILTALEAYSGAGLVELQADILAALRADAELSKFIYIDGFVIEHIGLNKEYTDQIVARQVAVQEKLKADEQTKASLAKAEKAKADAQADYEKTLVESRRDKEKEILAQQAISEKAIIAAAANAKNIIVTQNAESEKIVIAAKAEAERNIAISEAQQQADINRAVGIEAIGKANADANKSLLASYAVPGSDLFTRIQVAKSLSESFAGVKGYLPQNVTYNTVAENFNKGVSLLVGEPSAK